MRLDVASVGSLLTTAFVLSASSAAAADASAPPREPLVFVADPKMGVETTVRTVDSLSRVVFRYEDALPAFELDERTVSGKTIALLGRGLKLVFLDEPIADLTAAVAHEAGGHGARARELGVDASFSFRLPGIYRRIFSPGDDEAGSASTRFESGPLLEGDREILATLGGLEANYVEAWWINARIVRSGGWVHHGDLLVYSLAKLTYADAFFDIPQPGATSNDVSSYVSELQDNANLWRADDRRRIDQRLGAAYLWNLADPTLLYALYGTFYETLWRGERRSRMPLPELGDMTLLLSPRFALGPWGAENGLDVFLARGRTMLDCYARVGTTGIWDSYGFGARALGVPIGDRVGLGAELDLWRQPEIMLDDRAVYDRPYRLGINGGVFADVKVAGRFGLTGKLSAKTPGWIMGQPIEGGIYGYGGMTIAWQ